MTDHRPGALRLAQVVSVSVLAGSVLAGCAPAAGSPAGAGPAPSAVQPSAGAPAQAMLLPGVIDLLQPLGSEIIPDCDQLTAPVGGPAAPATCLLFLVDAPAGGARQEVDSSFLRSMRAAGWMFIGAEGPKRSFERIRAGDACGERAEIMVLEGPALEAVQHAASAGEAPISSAWQAYAIPASLSRVCAGDRMKP